MPASPTVSFTKGSDREVISTDMAQALKAAGTLIIDERRSRTRYFDGRFLAAKDEIREQNYFLTRLADLGRSSGTGVVAGLDVELTTPTTLTIKPGQGVTPAGETLMVPAPVAVPLADLAAVEQLDVTFGLSRLPRDLARNRSGLFVLGLRPVEFTANPVASYPTTLNGPRAVQDGDIIEAAAVTLVPYVEAGAGGSTDTRRARVARRVFVERGALGVPENVLPLAMIAMDRGIVQWLDPYLVRRELGAEQRGVLGFGFASRALRNAYVLQYLHQIREILQLRASSSLNQRFAASEYFEALPASGLLPSAAINPTDFSQIFFPAQIQVDLSIVPDDEVAVLVEESLVLPPVDLTDSPDELESTSVLVLVPVPRAQLPGLRQSLTTVTRRLRSAAPGLVFQRKPLESLRALTALRLPIAPLNKESPIDAAWRQALSQNPLLWYVRRRNLHLRDDVAGTRVQVSGDEFANEKAFSDRLTTLGLSKRFDTITSGASTGAVAVLTSRLASPTFANPLLAKSAITELEQMEKIDRPAALRFNERFGDPHLGEGLARLEESTPGVKTKAVQAVIAQSGRVPELDRLARSSDDAALADLGKEVVALAKERGDRAPARIAALVRVRLGLKP